jgi:hypothetical protein
MSVILYKQNLIGYLKFKKNYDSPATPWASTVQAGKVNSSLLPETTILQYKWRVHNAKDSCNLKKILWEPHKNIKTAL